MLLVTMENFKETFEQKVNELKVCINSFGIKDEQAYSNIIKEVLEAKSRQVKTSTDYRRLKRYDVLKVGDISKLIIPLNESGESNVKFYVHNSELYDIISNAHIEAGHGGIHKLEHNLKEEHVNITRQVIKVFLENCQTRIKKSTHPKIGIVKPMVFTEVNARAQVDLIDFQTCKDGSRQTETFTKSRKC